MTLNPILASVGSVCIILLTSVFFFLYDSYVNKERLYARDLLEAKRRFMRFVSHEVRTPLNAVCMGLAVMNSEIEPCVPTAGKESLTEEKEASLRTTGTPRDGARLFPTDSGATEFLALLTDVQVNAQSAVDVLNDMLNYDKVERRALALELDVLRPWHLIENVVNEFRLSAASKNIILSWTVATSGQRERGEGGTIDDMPQEADHASFLGDPVRIKQVLRNLISNAIKFTPEQGSVRIQVTAKESSKDHNWQTLKTTPKTSIRVRQCGTCKVQITDSGVGMSQDQLGKLFGEDVQFNRNTLQNGQGSGLGLYISKGIVERHNGILSAQSKGLGKGTTLTLKLPLYHVAQDGDKKPLSEPRADTSSTLETCMIEMPAPQNLHILLV
jgi:signal transduction histidine kinase